MGDAGRSRGDMQSCMYIIGKPIKLDPTMHFLSRSMTLVYTKYTFTNSTHFLACSTSGKGFNGYLRASDPKK